MENSNEKTMNDAILAINKFLTDHGLKPSIEIGRHNFSGSRRKMIMDVIILKATLVRVSNDQGIESFLNYKMVRDRSSSLYGSIIGPDYSHLMPGIAFDAAYGIEKALAEVGYSPYRSLRPLVEYKCNLSVPNLRLQSIAYQGRFRKK